jgi:hypothetical protein
VAEIGKPDRVVRREREPDPQPAAPIKQPEPVKG